jgi:hypothetical protein
MDRTTTIRLSIVGDASVEYEAAISLRRRNQFV